MPVAAHLRPLPAVGGRQSPYDGAVTAKLFLKATLVQAGTVAAAFAILLAAPLPEDFFREQGSFVGPLAWLACSLLTALILRLPVGRAIVAGLVSGGVAALAGVALGVLASPTTGHNTGVALGVVVFGATVALGRGYDTVRSDSAGQRAVGAAGIEPATSGLKGRRPHH